jgi:5-methylcytosine-specific restriction protein A
MPVRKLSPVAQRQRQGVTRAQDSASAAQAPTKPRTTPSRQHRAWQRVRAERLRVEPSCRPCRAEGKTTPASEVDHIVSIADGGALLDINNTQSLCHDHHADKSAADRARRTGRPVRRRRRIAIDPAAGYPLPGQDHWWSEPIATDGSRD